MPRLLVLSLDGQEFSATLQKVDREKLYGTVEIEAFDEKGKPASIKVLAADGKTLIDKGGTALEILDDKQNSVDRTKLVAVDLEGKKIDEVPSSFGRANELKTATVDQYLGLIVKSIYVLDAADGSSLKYLCEHLAGGQIFVFPFSYRGGLSYDSAFILGSKSEAFMVIGREAELQYLKLNQAGVLASGEEQEISADDLSFDF